MRVLRALFLTPMVIVLSFGLLFMQLAAVLQLTLLNPGFIVGTLDRIGFCDVAVDAALAAAAPPAGSPSYEGAMIIIEAAREALEPGPVLKIMFEVLSQVMRLVKDPSASPHITVDLASVRDAFIAGLVRAGHEHQATPEQLREIETGIRRNIPDTLDLVSQLKMDMAQFAGLARSYSQATRVLLIVLAVLATLCLLMVAVARRAWRAWLAAPFLLSGSVLLILASVAVTRGPHWLAKTIDLSRVLPPAVEAGAVTGLVLGFGRAVLLVAGAVAVAVVAIGCVLVWLSRKAGRLQARRV